MKILTWNIYVKNKNIRKALAFLKRQKADVICLQEFPAAHLNALKSFSPYIAVCDEVWVYKNNKKPDVKLYSIIISRFPIKEQVTIPHKQTYGHINRYQYFQADSFYVDIDTNEGLFRVFNSHFKCVVGPYHRIEQFKEVVSYLSPDRKNVICGDFNTFAKPFLNLFLGRYFGYNIKEIGINENKSLADLFSSYGLKNPLRRQVTFLKFPVQLDYILIPLDIDIKSKKVFLRSHGSDHFPLLLEI